jgi:hypothetical protein
MNKNILQKLLLLVCCILFLSLEGLLAQMPHDHIYMNKKQLCIAAVLGQSTWSEYWENTLKRDNLNMGTHTTQTAMLMAAYGVTDKLTLSVGLPYISTKTSAGNLMGQKGIQDVSLWAKYKLVKTGGLSLHGVVGASLPVGNYVPDFLPMSIGLQCKTLTGRAILNYTHPTGLYLGGHASYTYRSNIKVDRSAYQADGKVYNTNEVSVPNATDLGLRLGFLKKGRQLEVFTEQFACVGGDNIRRNDMPFPTNNMQMTAVGIYGKYEPKQYGVNFRVSKVLSGLNVGQSMSYSVGVLWNMTFKAHQP